MTFILLLFATITSIVTERGSSSWWSLKVPIKGGLFHGYYISFRVNPEQSYLLVKCLNVFLNCFRPYFQKSSNISCSITTSYQFSLLFDLWVSFVCDETILNEYLSFHFYKSYFNYPIYFSILKCNTLIHPSILTSMICFFFTVKYLNP